MFRSAADPAERPAGGGPGASQDVLAMLAPLLSAGITVNNVQVALTAFAGGITFGVMTVWSMFSNGMLVGVERTAGKWSVRDLQSGNRHSPPAR